MFALVWTALLPIGMVLSLMPQLRFGSVGPGELLILAWLLPGLVILLAGYRGEVPSALQNLGLFWALFATALCLGAIQTIVTGALNDWSLAFHDIGAYILLLVMTSVLFTLSGVSQRLDLIQWLTALFGTFFLALQVANAWGAFALNDIDPWYWDRLRGWAANPNVFALMAMIVGFLALELTETDVGMGAKGLATVCAVFSLGIGWLGRSNAYTIVVLGSFGLFGLLKAARAMNRLEGEGFPAIALGAAALAAIIYASCLIAPLIGSGGGAGGDALSLSVRQGEDQESEAKVRLGLWKEAIERGADSWMLGYGPGPHVEVPNSLTASHRTAGEPSNIAHPEGGLAPNYETHNTFLELFVQGGILAVGSFVWLGAIAVRRAWKAGRDGLIALLFAVAAFGSFHVVLRHPIVWIAISLALQAQNSSQRTEIARRRLRTNRVAGGRLQNAA